LVGEPVDPAGGTARRADRRGVPGNGEHVPADPDAALLRELTELRQHVERLEKQVRDRSVKLEDVSKRLTRLERRIDRASASFPVRTALSLRRRLHRMLK
jgi:predicted RNase H-like nuclease (RuvC/YqgF family)